MARSRHEGGDLQFSAVLRYRTRPLRFESGAEDTIAVLMREVPMAGVAFRDPGRTRDEFACGMNVLVVRLIGESEDVYRIRVDAGSLSRDQVSNPDQIPRPPGGPAVAG